MTCIGCGNEIDNTEQCVRSIHGNVAACSDCIEQAISRVHYPTPKEVALTKLDSLQEQESPTILGGMQLVSQRKIPPGFSVLIG